MQDSRSSVGRIASNGVDHIVKGTCRALSGTDFLVAHHELSFRICLSIYLCSKKAVRFHQMGDGLCGGEVLSAGCADDACCGVHFHGFNTEHVRHIVSRCCGRRAGSTIVVKNTSEDNITSGLYTETCAIVALDSEPMARV